MGPHPPRKKLQEFWSSRPGRRRVLGAELAKNGSFPLANSGFGKPSQPVVADLAVDSLTMVCKAAPILRPIQLVAIFGERLPKRLEVDRLTVYQQPVEIKKQCGTMLEKVIQSLFVERQFACFFPWTRFKVQSIAVGMSDGALT